MIEKTNNKPLIYVAGPLRTNLDKSWKENIVAAKGVCSRLLKAGVYFVSPHAMTDFVSNGHSEEAMIVDKQDFWEPTFIKLLMGCDALLVIGRYDLSEGTQYEILVATELGIPIYYTVEALLEDYSTILPKEKQCFAYKYYATKNYFTFIRKNKDYSEYNIKGTGLVGCVTRMWDKMARIMNLVGFDIGTGEFVQKPLKAENESLDDSFLDQANYSLIAQIYKSGWWGK